MIASIALGVIFVGWILVLTIGDRILRLPFWAKLAIGLGLTAVMTGLALLERLP